MNSDAYIAHWANQRAKGIKLSHERLNGLLEALGNPHHRLPPTIHIAGTNGKGSTLAYLRAMYEAQGYRVHAFTSPHLVRFHERIVLANHDISETYLCELFERLEPTMKAHDITFFEAITALAFVAFSEVSADVLLLEVGMGGRLDSTNVIPHKLASVITPIGYDHKEFLGDTLAQIAHEKAGIMQQGVPAIIALQHDEAAHALLRHATSINANTITHGDGWHFNASAHEFVLHTHGHTLHLPPPSLAGAHQYENAALAATAALALHKKLPITDAAIAHGVSHAKWPARLQRLTHGPLVEAWVNKGAVILDGGHNPHAAHAIAAYAQSFGKITLVCGMMARKDVQEFLNILAPHVSRLFAVPLGDEGASPDDIAACATQGGIHKTEALNSIHALTEALKHCDASALFICGSLYLAGEILKNHG